MPRNSHNPGSPTLPAAVAQAWPPADWDAVNVILAVSGGADSVAMLRALASIKTQVAGPGRLAAAHFNHRTRGDASDGDERFVRALADELGVPCLVGHAESPVASEEEARDARYAFLVDAARQRAARFVATAHTQDDQIETVLFRVLRGSGLVGLGGIPSQRPLTDSVTLVRPLLGVSRAAVEGYLAEIRQEYRRDATNDSQQFTRNWLRHELLPLVRERMGETAPQSLLSLAEQAADLGDWMAVPVADFVETAIATEPDGHLSIECVACRSAPRALLLASLRHAWREQGWPEQAMTHRHWRQLGEMATANEPLRPITLPGNVRAERWAERLVLAPPAGRGS
ncbi:MAG: tRNA lysidine(34) synthetase TilS [Planctomycetota bacterium]